MQCRLSSLNSFYLQFFLSVLFISCYVCVGVHTFFDVFLLRVYYQDHFQFKERICLHMGMFALKSEIIVN